MTCYQSQQPLSAQHQGAVYPYDGPDESFRWRATLGLITGATEGYGRRSNPGNANGEVLFSTVVAVRDLNNLTHLQPPMRVCGP
jgi:hypothetical protein